MSKMDSYLCAIFRRIFRLFPINQRKVVFCSYYGKGYSDNPKAIAESLLASGQHLKLVWLLQDRRDATSFPPESGPPPIGAFIGHGSCLQLQSGWTIAGEENGASGKANTICKPGTALP